MDCNLYVDEFINIITEDTEKKVREISYEAQKQIDELEKEVEPITSTFSNVLYAFLCLMLVIPITILLLKVLGSINLFSIFINTSGGIILIFVSIGTFVYICYAYGRINKETRKNLVEISNIKQKMEIDINRCYSDAKKKKEDYANLFEKTICERKAYYLNTKIIEAFISADDDKDPIFQIIRDFDRKPDVEKIEILFYISVYEDKIFVSVRKKRDTIHNFDILRMSLDFNENRYNNITNVCDQIALSEAVASFIQEAIQKKFTVDISGTKINFTTSYTYDKASLSATTTLCYMALNANYEELKDL